MWPYFAAASIAWPNTVLNSIVAESLDFVAGELTLFQIRPLVERGALRADRAVQLMFGDADNEAAESGSEVDLLLPPLTRMVDR